jgi:uncharacterized protein YbjT (DUF2867 family)
MATPSSQNPCVLVLGATGTIGSATARHLLEAGFDVSRLARKPNSATRGQSKVDWRYADLGRLQKAEDWQPLLLGCTAVVNAAGALQDGGQDDLAEVHVLAIKALTLACQHYGVRRIVHVSAPNVNPAASTKFYRTKAAGDQAIIESGLEWVIVRPVVVLAPQAYGGTALLRALAALPFAIPAVQPDSLMQTVSIDDVTEAIVMGVDGRLPSKTDIALCEPDSHTVGEVLLAIRTWLKLDPVPVIAVPGWMAMLGAKAADLAGLLGWRSPLRTTALTVAAEGVAGDSNQWAKLTGKPCRSLGETLQGMPSTVQERLFARVYLLKPVLILCLALFWLVSGLIGLWQKEAATQILESRNVDASLAGLSVVGGSLTDIALGLSVLYRPWSRIALLGMFALTLAYLVLGSMAAPDLWLDPLGPFIKALPGIGLALAALAILPDR